LAEKDKAVKQASVWQESFSENGSALKTRT
jgi:hypothetical protein